MSDLPDKNRRKAEGKGREHMAVGQNGYLKWLGNGNKDCNLRSSSALILTHKNMGLCLKPKEMGNLKDRRVSLLLKLPEALGVLWSCQRPPGGTGSACYGSVLVLKGHTKESHYMYIYIYIYICVYIYIYIWGGGVRFVTKDEPPHEPKLSGELGFERGCPRIPRIFFKLPAHG